MHKNGDERMKVFKTYLKNKGVIGAIFMALIYQIIMISVFMPGYSAIPKNVDQLSVAIVNEDDHYGKMISKQMKESLPFKKIETNLDIKEAKEKLDDRDIHMVIQIPEDFSKKMADQKEKVNLDFYINEANPATVTSVMQNVISGVESQLNKGFAASSSEGILLNLNVPKDQAKELSQSIPDKLESNIVTLNEVPAGMQNQMAPLFLTMVSYVGSMIAALMLVSAFKSTTEFASKWKAFFSMQGVAVLISLVAPIVGIGIYFMVHGYGSDVFIQLWFHHFIQMFVSFQFNFVFILLLGQIGMIANITLLLMQTISSGAIMTQDMMFGVYKVLSYISPMYYSVQSDFSIMFGGGNLTEYTLKLILIGVVILIMNILITIFTVKNRKLAKSE